MFWKTCLKTFFNGQDAQEATKENDEIEVFTLVDHILDSLGGREEASMMIDDAKSIEPGLLSYVQAKLGRKAHKVDKLLNFLYQTLRVSCFSVKNRFHGRKKIASIIKNRPDLKQDLDQKSIKWLAAIAVCEIYTDYPGSLDRKAISVFVDEPKKNSCIGKLFRKQNKN